jgi:hypothetical protein
VNEQELIDALHVRWTAKHQAWLAGQERKRARLNGVTDMGCKGKKGRGGRGGGRGR